MARDSSDAQLPGEQVLVHSGQAGGFADGEKVLGVEAEREFQQQSGTRLVLWQGESFRNIGGDFECQ